MKFLPLENITYKTPLSANEAIRTLAENVEPEKFQFFPNLGAKTYKGKIEGNTFNIKPATVLRNSFVPQISGVVGDEPNGAIIRVKMSFQPIVTAFIFIFTAFFFVGWIKGIYYSILNKNFSVDQLVGGLFVPIPYVIPRLIFNYQSKKAQETLRELFQAEITSD